MLSPAERETRRIANLARGAGSTQPPHGPLTPANGCPADHPCPPSGHGRSTHRRFDHSSKLRNCALSAHSRTHLGTPDSSPHSIECRSARGESMHLPSCTGSDVLTDEHTAALEALVDRAAPGGTRHRRHHSAITQRHRHRLRSHRALLLALTLSAVFAVTSLQLCDLLRLCIALTLTGGGCEHCRVQASRQRLSGRSISRP